MQEICTLGSAWGDESKKPRSLGEGTGAKAPDNSEAPQRATASRLVSTIPPSLGIRYRHASIARLGGAGEIDVENLAVHDEGDFLGGQRLLAF